MEKFAFVIGHRWPNGDIGDYMVHNQTVFNGDAEEAKRVLEYCKRTTTNKEDKLEIYKLV